MKSLFKLYGIEACKVEGEIPFFNKQALERFCYNNDYEREFPAVSYSRRQEAR